MNEKSSSIISIFVFSFAAAPFQAAGVEVRTSGKMVVDTHLTVSGGDIKVRDTGTGNANVFMENLDWRWQLWGGSTFGLNLKELPTGPPGGQLDMDMLTLDTEGKFTFAGLRSGPGASEKSIILEAGRPRIYD